MQLCMMQVPHSPSRQRRRTPDERHPGDRLRQLEPDLPLVRLRPRTLHAQQLSDVALHHLAGILGCLDHLLELTGSIILLSCCTWPSASVPARWSPDLAGSCAELVVMSGGGKPRKPVVPDTHTAKVWLCMIRTYACGGSRMSLASPEWRSGGARAASANVHAKLLQAHDRRWDGGLLPDTELTARPDLLQVSAMLLIT